MFAAFFYHDDTENYANLALDRFSCNSIGRGKRPGGTCPGENVLHPLCLLYTSDAADE